VAAVSVSVGAMEPLSSVGPDDLLGEAAESLGIRQNLLELEVDGVTVIPPEKVASADFIGDLREAVVSLHKRRSDDAAQRAKLQAAGNAGAGELCGFALWEDPIFETALMNPVVQTLARAMCGHTSRLSLMMGGVKSRGEAKLGLHCDTEMTEPYPPVPQFGNVTYALSDYSAENGATVFVRGSHRLQRQPHGSEVDGDLSTLSVAGSLSMPRPVPIDAPAGSIIAWNGLTWHGANPRTAQGERISLLMLFCRWYMHPQERYQDQIPPGALERHGPRFAQLLDVIPGWAFKGDPTADVATAISSRLVCPILDVPRP
jgi:hypothetical protein